MFRTAAKLFTALLLLPWAFYAQEGTWEPVDIGATVDLLHVNFVDDRAGWVGGGDDTHGVIYRTFDAGFNWQLQHDDLPSAVFRIEFITPQLGFYVDATGAVYRSTDGGASWNVNLQFSDAGFFAVDMLDENVGVACGYYWDATQSDFRGLTIFTADGGVSWGNKTFSRTVDELFYDVKFKDNNTGYAGGSQGIYQSFDGGASWYGPLSVPDGNDFFAVWVNDGPVAWAVGQGGVVSRTEDGENWTYRILGSFDINDVEFITDAVGWAVGSNGTILYSSDGGGNYEINNPPFLSGVEMGGVDAISETLVYACGSGGNLIRYSEGGTANTITVMQPNGGEVLTAGNQYRIEWTANFSSDFDVEYSTDDGANWTLLGNVAANNFEWTVPDTPSDNCLVAISTPNGEVFDLSDGVFTIQSATANEPGFVVSKRQLEFGDVPVGSTASRTFTLGNPGSAPLEFSIDFTNPDVFSAEPLSGAVSPGASQEITVNFTPDNVAAYEDAVIISHNAAADDGESGILLVGNGVDSNSDVPLIALSATNIDFGSVTVGETVSRMITVTNDGTAGLEVTSISIDRSEFAADPTALSVPGGASRDVTVFFSPSDAVEYNAVISFESNADPATVNANLSGAGVTEQVPDIALSAATLVFGDVIVGEIFEKGIDVTNNGTADLNVTDVVIDNQAFVLQSAAQFTVPPGNTHTTFITFEPGAEGDHTGTVTFTSNAGDASARLAGRGIAQSGGPGMQLSTDFLEFGDVNVGGQKGLTFSVSNTGDAQLSVTDVASDNGVFVPAVTQFTVAAGGSQEVEVYFNPDAAGDHDGTIAVHADGFDTPAEFQVHGKGVAQSAPAITLDKNSVSFGAVMVGENTSQTFAIENTGDANLIISAISSSDGQFVPSPTAFTVTPGASNTVTVRFAPSSTGAKSASLTIEHNAGNGTTTVSASGVGYEYPSSFTANSSLTFPTHTDPASYSSSDYRLVGVPGNSNQPFGNFLNGSQGSDWEVYWDNGTSSDYYVKYDGSSNFRTGTGKAFWLIYRGSWSVSSSVSTPTLDANGDAVIPLAAGRFNLITNPFITGISWARIEAYNGFSQPLATWNGSGWTSPSVFGPYIGYLFDNRSANISSIKVPFRFTQSSSKEAPMLLSDNYSWKVEVELISDEYADRATFFGVKKNSLPEADQFDYRKPRGPFEAPHVYFERAEWDEEYPVFGGDFRPVVEGVQVWDMTVASGKGENLTIAFHFLDDVPEEYAVLLVDKARAKFTDLREQNAYSFTASASHSGFKVIVGDPALVEAEKAAVAPVSYELFDNYPNPFNPETTISFSVPEKTEASLIIYNMLGEQVKTLFSGELGPGKHYYTWKGDTDAGVQTATGVYVYRLTAGGETFAKKMMLLK